MRRPWSGYLIASCIPPGQWLGAIPATARLRSDQERDQRLTVGVSLIKTLTDISVLCVFFDSVLVCGALFDTAFHEVLITCLLVVRWFWQEGQAKKETRATRTASKPFLIAHVWVSQFAKIIKNTREKRHVQPFCVVCWSLFSPLRPDVFKDAFKCFPSYQ